MKTRKLLRNSVIALAGAACLTAGLGAEGAHAAVVSNDSVIITNQGIDFGNNSFVFGAPVGSANVAWDLTGVIVRPRVTGTLHLDNVAQEWGRIHVGYFDTGGKSLATYHGGSVQAPSNAHYAWSVDINPPGRSDLDHVEICTELSGNNVTFTQIGCKVEYF